MTARNQFRFTFTAEALLTGAEAKASYRRGREDFHKTEADRLEVELKDKGVQLLEHQVTGGVQFQPKFDAGLMASYNNHRSREAEHKRMAEEYEAWGRAFALAATSEIFELDVDDVTYFGL